MRAILSHYIDIICSRLRVRIEHKPVVSSVIMMTLIKGRRFRPWQLKTLDLVELGGGNACHSRRSHPLSGWVGSSARSVAVVHFGIKPFTFPDEAMSKIEHVLISMHLPRSTQAIPCHAGNMFSSLETCDEEVMKRFLGELNEAEVGPTWSSSKNPC